MFDTLISQCIQEDAVEIECDVFIYTHMYAIQYIHNAYMYAYVVAMLFLHPFLGFILSRLLRQPNIRG